MQSPWRQRISAPRTSRLKATVRLPLIWNSGILCNRSLGLIERKRYNLLTATDANPVRFPGGTGEFQARRVRDLAGRGKLDLTQELIALVAGFNQFARMIIL
jgi:hypothetical protein